jgi:hypothetical protein
MDELVVKCAMHRRICAIPVSVRKIMHVDGSPCDSKRFTLRRESLVGRDEAEAALDKRRQELIEDGLGRH